MGGKLIKTSQLINSAMLKKIVFVDEFTKMLREGYFCPTTFLTWLIHFFFHFEFTSIFKHPKWNCFYVETTLDINVVLRVGFFGRFWKYEVKWCFFYSDVCRQVDKSMDWQVDMLTIDWSTEHFCWQDTYNPFNCRLINLSTCKPV